MKNALAYIVIEYLPHAMINDEWRPARIDGHYGSRAVANEIAQFWAEKPLHPESRIVVAEIVSESKAPAHWIKRGDAA